MKSYSLKEIQSLSQNWDRTGDWKFWKVISEISDMLPEGEYKIETKAYRIQKRMSFPLDYKTYLTWGKRWKLYSPQEVPNEVREKLKGMIWEYAYVDTSHPRYIEIVRK